MTVSEETRPRGRAVASSATIITSTMPDGSRQHVLSHPFLTCEKKAFEWIQLIAGENPDKWLDYRNLLRFITGGEPLGGKISHKDKIRLRQLLARIKRVALSEGAAIVTKGDPISHFRLSNGSLEDKRCVHESAVLDRVREMHFGKKASTQAEILGVGVESLDDVISHRQ